MKKEQTVIPRGVILEIIDNKKKEMIPSISSVCSEVYGSTLKLLEDALKGSENIYSQMDKVVIREVINKINTLLNDDITMFYRFYNDFAQNNDCMIKDDEGYDRSKPETELTDRELARYQKYLSSTDLIVNSRTLIAQYLRTCPFPTISVKYQDANQALHFQLVEHRKQVIQKLLPNLRDDEAKIMMSHDQATVADVLN